MRYIKKQTEVQVAQWKGSDNAEEIMNMLGVNEVRITRGCSGNIYLTIDGLGGFNKGDYIVKNSDGSVDKCSEEKFNELYEKQPSIQPETKKDEDLKQETKIDMNEIVHKINEVTDDKAEFMYRFRKHIESIPYERRDELGENFPEYYNEYKEEKYSVHGSDVSHETWINLIKLSIQNSDYSEEHYEKFYPEDYKQASEARINELRGVRK